MNQFTNQSMHEWVNESVMQQVRKWMSERENQSMSQLASQWENESVRQCVSQQVSQWVSECRLRIHTGVAISGVQVAHLLLGHLYGRRAAYIPLLALLHSAPSLSLLAACQGGSDRTLGTAPTFSRRRLAPENALCQDSKGFSSLVHFGSGRRRTFLVILVRTFLTFLVYFW